jgi:hypothetical protein
VSGFTMIKTSIKAASHSCVLCTKLKNHTKMASFRFLVLLLIVLIVIPQGFAQPGCDPVYGYAMNPAPPFVGKSGETVPVDTPSIKTAPVKKPHVRKPRVEKHYVFKPPVKKPHVRKPRVEKP